ncbi:hypothetical protein G5V57_08835 [Nordella sp. HKS 07]|uniref:hypothetical protein n=1 Tax=Nordella sp. HKS 07 TaxID=2712222 RepID=UPI0013E11B6A|nr:hypothetical protein [Nordella sp. HKS 07]QIG47818.1 hypothetical protein G5V57_08835 [Nordella sp. HKS 07]
MRSMTSILLAGSAVALNATVAKADDLSALKVELEALQNRVSQLEAQPKAALPSGYSLLTIRDGQADFRYFTPQSRDDTVPEDSGFTISVLPTADVAPVAEVSISGEIRTAVMYTDFDSGANADVINRGRLVIMGKAQTAVGEVGGYVRLQANGGGDFSDYSEDAHMNKAYGWWDFAPNWRLLAGFEDTTATLLYSWDYYAATAPTRTFGPSYIYNEQMRVTYSDETFSFAVALEDPDFDQVDERSDVPSVIAYATYTSDPFTGQIVGLWQQDTVGDEDDWSIGGGFKLGIAKNFDLIAAAVIGEGTSIYSANLSPITPDEDFWDGSIGILANLTEHTRIELGVGYEDYDVAGKALGYGGGVYWDPVSQLTVGAGATYIDFNDAFTEDDDTVTPIEDNSLEIFLGTWLRFK